MDKLLENCNIKQTQRKTKENFNSQVILKIGLIVKNIPSNNNKEIPRLDDFTKDFTKYSKITNSSFKEIFSYKT